MNAPNLAALQRQMANAVMRPLTKNETMQKRDANGASTAKEAASFIKPNDRLTSFERLEIYNRQYWFRVFSSFEEDFPGVKSLVGTRRFEALMRAYLEAHPSSSFTLRNLGSSLVAWLKQNPHYAGTNPESVIAMAALEWAHIEAFDNEKREPITAEQIATINDGSRLALQPYLRLLDLPYAVDDALLAIRDSSHDEASQASNAVSIHLVRRARAARRPKHEHIYLAVHRHDDTVYYKRLAREDYLLLHAFDQGVTLSDAIDAALIDTSIPEGDRPAFIHSAFTNWMQMGWLCSPVEETQ
jgi:hypothetical protein